MELAALIMSAAALVMGYVGSVVCLGLWLSVRRAAAQARRNDASITAPCVEFQRRTTEAEAEAEAEAGDGAEPPPGRPRLRIYNAGE